jgi:L-amino acid N-acyltransferase YncA
VAVAAVVRQAVAGDARELARLRWDFREEEQPGRSRSAFLASFEEWFRGALSTGRWVVVVAESQPGVVCGCMYLECIDKVPSPAATASAWGYVTNCYIASEWRRAGLGTQMLQSLVREARARRLEFLIVWPSREAVSFYRRAGFQPVADVHAGDDDSPPLELNLSE